jgi:NADH dehydrogenase
MPRCYDAELNNLQNVDTDGLANLIEAAGAAGVERFVYTSFTMDNDFPLRNAKRTVEGHLKGSGLTYTILRPSYFMETWLTPVVGFDYPNAKAQIYGTGQNPISWISVLDVARFAVESLDNPAARNAILELGGPEALSQLQAVEIFEEASGQTFELQHVPVEALAEQQETATDPMQQSFAGLMRWYAQGDPVDMQETLQTFPMELTSVKDYAKNVFSTS